MDTDKDNVNGAANGHGRTLPDGQLVLLEAESDEALLLAPEQRQKLFTGALAQKIADRLDMILALISCRLPLAEIALRAHVSHHTLRELIGQHAVLIATDMDRYAGWTAGLSAKFLALAELKAADAPFKDLVAAHSFVGKLSLDMKVASQQLMGVGDAGAVTEVEADNPALKSARDFLAGRNKTLTTDEHRLTQMEEAKT